MARSVAVMTRVSPETKEQLAKLAKEARRSEAFIANEAIEAYVAHQAWMAEYIAEALREHLENPDECVSHEEVAKWLDSRGTPDELPMPQPKRR